MSDVNQFESDISSSQEIENFENMAKYIVPSPGDIPKLKGIEIYGESLPLNGQVGGDHIIYLDFNNRFDLEARIATARENGREDIVKNLIRCRQKAGIALADVSGHQMTDALLSLMLHQSFLIGAAYELDKSGDVSTTLFEKLNTRFYKSSSVSKYLTMVYGEISEKGRFRFISVGHPIPVVFSSLYDRFVDISKQTLTTFPPIGLMPSLEDIDRRTSQSILGFKEGYEVNELNLMGSGDILVLYSDGLSDHENGSENYFPERLEDILRRKKHFSAQQIFEAIKNDLRCFASPSDDITIVVIKKE